MNILKRFSTKLKQNESGASMIFAVVVMLIAATVSILIATLSLATIAGSQNLAASSASKLAADEALADAVATANLANQPNAAGSGGLRNLQAREGEDNRKTGTTKTSTYPTSWAWWVEPTSSVGEYTLRVSGYPTDAEGGYASATAYKASYTLDGTSRLAVTTQSSDGQTAARYVAADTALFTLAPFIGYNEVVLQDYTPIRSYNSRVTSRPTLGGTNSGSDQATLAVGGTLSLGTSTGLNKLFYPGGASGSNFCDPSSAGCGENPPVRDVRNIADRLDIPCDSRNQQVLGAWRSSSGQALNARGCYESITFDSNYELPSNYSIDNPLGVYTRGPIVFESGVQVNRNNRPAALQVYSSGGSALLSNGPVSTPTRISAVIGGNDLGITDSDSVDGVAASTSTVSSPTLEFYGAMAGATVNLGSRSAVFLDVTIDGSLQPGGNNAGRRIWEVSAPRIGW